MYQNNSEKLLSPVIWSKIMFFIGLIFKIAKNYSVDWWKFSFRNCMCSSIDSVIENHCNKNSGKMISPWIWSKILFFIRFQSCKELFCWIMNYFNPNFLCSLVWFNQAKVQEEVLSKRSNWTGWKASQACAQQSSQMDCNIKLTHPTRTIQKLTEDLSEGKSKPSSTFFS